MMDDKNEENCLECRLASGAGLAVGSLYMYRQSLNQKTKFNKNGMLIISAGKYIVYGINICQKCLLIYFS